MFASLVIFEVSNTALGMAAVNGPSRGPAAAADPRPQPGVCPATATAFVPFRRIFRQYHRQVVTARAAIRSPSRISDNCSGILQRSSLELIGDEWIVGRPVLPAPFPDPHATPSG